MSMVQSLTAVTEHLGNAADQLNAIAESFGGLRSNHEELKSLAGGVN